MKDIFLNWLAAPVKVDDSSHIPRFCPKLGQFVRLELMTVDVRAQQWLSISGPANNRKLVIKHFSHVSLRLINSSYMTLVEIYWLHISVTPISCGNMNSNFSAEKLDSHFSATPACCMELCRAADWGRRNVIRLKERRHSFLLLFSCFVPRYIQGYTFRSILSRMYLSKF